VFDGYDDEAGTKNPDAKLRGTGHVALNVLGDAETGWFFSQERLTNTPYLAVGAGADYQDDASLITSTNGPDRVIDNNAFVADFQSGFPAGPLFATVNGGWYLWDNATFDGDTAFIEAGLRHKTLQVTCKVSHQEPDDKDSITDATVGLHHYRKNHNARAGIEYRWGDSAEQVLLGFQIAL
jgi:hypothetical protein